ncbi:MAG: type I glutamate--ammonia ligase [Gammaproteobacteria bacterium AqS3]|nr:type I glutamate--ammonia ligase [Gammaproteobacteria bacterium AqS3]
MAGITPELQQFLDEGVKWVDLRFTDFLGKERHITAPVHELPELLRDGKPFDGSSIAGWKGINESDMVLKLKPETAVLDPFIEAPTVAIACGVFEPSQGKPYNRAPREVAVRAEEYLAKTGIADTAYFGPEPEFFIFDDVRWQSGVDGASFHIGSDEGSWENARVIEGGNLGHRPGIKGGYFSSPPMDSMHALRNEMCEAMQEMGVTVEVHHHEVGGPGQGEISMRFNSLTTKADEVQIYKYCIHNVARLWGKTATFMPKPIVGDNGSGMHCHQSLSKDGVNIFSGRKYAGLSQEALYYIGGIIKHARTLNAFTNASTNSYKRLVPGFEAPVILAYSGRNRSAAVRIPWTASSKSRRIEVRFPDPTANPYLAFAAMLMAGIDGIRNKIDPGKAASADLYTLSLKEQKKLPTVCPTFEAALLSLDDNREFLCEGGVFDDDLIDAYIDLKMKDVERVNQAVHPDEFELYYGV